MRAFMRVLRVEVMKVRWPLTLAILAVAPILSLLMSGSPAIGQEFESYYLNSVMVYGWLFYPIVAGILAALVCRTEHLNGGWKQLLVLPVRRAHVYAAKYVVVAVLLLVSQVLIGGCVVAGMAMAGRVGDVLWRDLGIGLLNGWIAVLPLAALQMWASVKWKAFGGPLALNVTLTVPALFAVQSDKYGPWYPWGQPILAMMAAVNDDRALTVSVQTLVYVIIGGFVVWFFGGLIAFVRGDVHV